MLQAERTFAEWFQEADRCYREAHQGCPWCGNRNEVYKSERRNLIEFHCGCCDFYVSADLANERHYMTPGDDRRSAAAPQTMYAIEWDDSATSQKV